MVKVHTTHRAVVSTQLALTTFVVYHYRFQVPAVAIRYTARASFFSALLLSFVIKLLLTEVAYYSHKLQ